MQAHIMPLSLLATEARQTKARQRPEISCREDRYGSPTHSGNRLTAPGIGKECERMLLTLYMTTTSFCSIQLYLSTYFFNASPHHVSVSAVN